MRRFDLLDEFTTVYVSMTRPCEVRRPTEPLGENAPLKLTIRPKHRAAMAIVIFALFLWIGSMT